MALVSPKLTYEDLLATPDDGKRYEIIDGELFVSASPLLPHQRAAWNLCDFLKAAEQAGYGQGFFAPVDVVFDNFNIVVPDLAFVLTERLGILTEANIQGAPDLVVEVLSPSTRQRDVGIKMQLYARFGVRYYYVVDAKTQTIQPHELVQGAYRALPVLSGEDALTCPLFPGISMLVVRVFAP